MILDWSKPGKAMTTEEWQAISADSAPPGVYTPNMSREDMAKWKARHVGGRNPRVEIRKTTRNGTQILMTVTLGTVAMSMNGRAELSAGEFGEMHKAAGEARAVLAQAIAS
jgi:hypothetical protein